MLLDKKFNSLREIMASQGISVLLLAPGPHMNWLFGFCPLPDERPCFACLTVNRISFLVPSLNLEQFRSELDYPFFVWRDEEGPLEAFGKLILELSLPEDPRIAVDETMRADFLFLIQQVIPKADILFSKSSIGYLRMLKTEFEFEKLKKSALLADNCMLYAFEKISSNSSEKEISELIDQAFQKQGAKPGFSLVASGRNAAFPHHHSGQDKLTKGKPIIIDIGGVYDGYFSDITRMAYVGRPSERYLAVHNIVEEALIKAIDRVHIGATAGEVDQAARGMIEKAGFGEYFVHRTGHGLGLEIHEPPFIARNSPLILEEGMVFTVEPGIYMPKEFGVRLEEVVYLAKEGPRILSNISREIRIID